MRNTMDKTLFVRLQSRRGLISIGFKAVIRTHRGGCITMTLQGKVVLVTGASRGIGRALARGFAADGASVIAFARSAQDLQETAHGHTEHFLMVVGDVTSEADVDRLVATTYERFGQIDVLVNNAGIGNAGELLARPFSDWAEVIRVNLIGLALCTHRVLPGMIERGYGRVINVVSRAAESPWAGVSAYAASKAGVISLTRALATEVGPPKQPDILINALIPGPTNTAMTRQAGWDPTRLQDPEAVYPHTRFLVTLPVGGPHGRVFWNSQEYEMYTQFNNPHHSEEVSQLLRTLRN
jgi:NAD(P)-dependent dehydrogenase (short-subunit alcohol dehydrogenase family)